MKNIFIICLLFLSCSTVKNFPPCSGVLQTDIKKSGNWQYIATEKDKYYKAEKHFRDRLTTDYKDCFMSMNEQQVIDLLGKPNEIDDKSLSYLITPPSQCNSTGDGSLKCGHLVFNFDTDKRITYVNVEYSGSIRHD